MEVKAWSSGGGVYGIRVGATNRDKHFSRSWTSIDVEIDGHRYEFRLTPGFWKKCPEFRDSGTTVLKDWLRVHQIVPWPVGQPPRCQLLPIGDRRFQLRARKK
jgi:hypothetical protein